MKKDKNRVNLCVSVSEEFFLLIFYFFDACVKSSLR